MEAEARRSGGPSPAFEPGVLRHIAVPRVVVCLDASSSIDEARLGMLASNFYWAAWAAVMAEGRAAAAPAAATVFDYAAYDLVRAREFSRLKKQLLSLDDGAAAEAEAAAAAGEAAAAAAAATLAADC
jgi:hypothetical protein